MSDKKSQIFRQQTLERLSSLEQLDQLMQIVSLKDWLLLSGLVFFGVIAVLWSIFGSIPISVTAKGVLINPRRLLQLHSPISEQLQSLNIRDGQCVKKDAILAIIDPSAKKQQLQQQRDKLAQLKLQTQNSTLVREQATQLELEVMSAQRISLQERLQDTEEFTPRIKDKKLTTSKRKDTGFMKQLGQRKRQKPNTHVGGDSETPSVFVAG